MHVGCLLFLAGLVQKSFSKGDLHFYGPDVDVSYLSNSSKFIPTVRPLLSNSSNSYTARSRNNFFFLIVEDLSSHPASTQLARLTLSEFFLENHLKNR